MIRLVVLMFAMGGAAMAQDLAPTVSSEPIQRSEASVPSAPVPDRPASDSAEAATDAPDAVSTKLGARDLLRLNDADYGTCLAALDDLGVVYTEAAPIIPADDVDCGIVRPLTVSEIAPGVSLIPEATLRCPAVRAVAEWTRDFVLPAAQRLGPDTTLAAMETASGYTCRRRNNRPDGKLSEHAFGNAIDILGFRFADRNPITVEPREGEGSIEESFQDAVRAAACLDFSTVLGPGSNASHDDHLHLDIIERSSGYRLCEQGGAAPE
ncbi:extensin-like domain-containing protein [Jannaschia donghaensis]|uniref:Extensin-like C-terminal domain-containing protein n=1 Tax=Jannaschia donghaensis TaxID=420998 RepID=A0A0M6YNP6_9RHOB|nr:extensin family protein [Jannaschia donghaensis]CTQ50626.1 hypothetical protein JDO7802_02651 [Jannaschia donghaensis]